MDIGSRIQRIRGKMSRAEFAEQLGIHPQTLYMYEKGKRVMDVDLLQALCAKFHVSVEWLIFGGKESAAEGEEDASLLREQLAEKEACIAEKDARISQLQNELISAQAGALKAYELAVGALRYPGDGAEPDRDRKS